MVVGGINNLVEDWQNKIKSLQKEISDTKVYCDEEIEKRIASFRGMNGRTEDLMDILKNMKESI